MSTKPTADIFSEDNEVKSAWVTWGKPGDHVMGTLIARYERENSISGKTEMQMIYEIKASKGQFHPLKQDDNGNYVPEAEPVIINAEEVYNVGGKPAIDSQMRNVKIGQIIGMKFVESVPAKEKGRYPTKVVKIYTQGLMDDEFLAGMEAQDPDKF
jgi:hypothetical protein